MLFYTINFNFYKPSKLKKIYYLFQLKVLKLIEKNLFNKITI